VLLALFLIDLAAGLVVFLPLVGRRNAGVKFYRMTFIISAALAACAAGVNNHMGSRATRDTRVMTSMLTAMPKGMYFIDSRTVPGSVGERIARELKIPTASRQVFLDDVQREGDVRRQLQQLAAAAEEHGVAIGIGHMYDVTVRVLNDEIPNLRNRGFRLRRASESVN